MKRLYTCIEGHTKGNTQLVKSLSEVIKEVFPDSAHSIFLDRIYAAKLPREKEAAFQAYKNYYGQVQSSKVAPEEASRELIRVLHEKPKLDFRFTYCIVSVLLNESLFEQHGINNIELAIVRDIEHDKASKLLTAVCELSPYSYIDSDYSALIPLLERLFSRDYDPDWDIAAAFNKIKKAGTIIEDEEEGMSFSKDSNPMPALKLLSCIGYETIFNWATSTDPLLRGNTLKTLRMALVSARPELRKNLYENKINELIFSNQEFLKLAMDLAGWHPFQELEGL